VPSDSQIHEAGRRIRAGELVVFPTETVYGLGANALDAVAVDRIYEAKGRPATSPLIVHVDGIEMAQTLVTEWPEAAEKLARRYWPGPLTLVLPKRPHVPDRVTAGLPTVGIRVPAHPVALALIRAAGVPIAAPSANPFTGVSPTTAQHVREGLGDRVSYILDGGPAGVGIESTVLSLGGGNAVLLRPGMLSQQEIETMIGPVTRPHSSSEGAHAAPGMHRKHYSPATPVVLVEGGRLPSRGRGAYLCFSESLSAGRTILMPAEPTAYAAKLYATLHTLDAEGWDWIAVERPPDRPAWAGILDRLERAANR
jgi:L-threonylcarbamoyladenylate synthase